MTGEGPLDSSSGRGPGHLRDLVLCLSLANLYCANVWIELANPLTYQYRAVPPRAAMIGALIAVLLLLALFFWCGLLLVRALPLRWRRPAGAVAVVAALWLPACLFVVTAATELRLSAAGVAIEPVAAALGRRGLLAILAVAAVVFAALLIRRTDLMVRVVTTALLVLAPVLPLLAVQAAWVHLQRPSDAAFAGVMPTANPSSQKTRLIWFLFDEWDYRAAFSERPAGLMLPELDRLRQEAFSATRAVGGTARTAGSLPSMLMGQRAMETVPAGPGELMVRLPGSDPSAPMVGLSSQPLLFQKLRKLGWTSAVAAWYFPQCRIFGGQLDRCTWEPGASIYNRREYTEEVAIPDRMKLIVTRQLARVPFLDRLPFVNPREEERRLRYREYSRILESATASLDSAAFVMVHWPVPHYPAIYSRRERRVGADVVATYIDNLVLVDQIVGRFRRLLEQRGTWDDTIVLLSSDHGLRRDQLPRPELRTEEERRLAAGPGRLFVPMIVKLARNRDAITYTQPFSIMLVHDMLLELAGGRVRTPGALATWIDANRSRFPVPPAALRH